MMSKSRQFADAIDFRIKTLEQQVHHHGFGAFKRYPWPWRSTTDKYFGRAGNRSVSAHASTLANSHTSASLTRRTPASIFDRPPRLRSHPASCSFAASASCDNSAVILRRRTWGPTRFCVFVAIVPFLELDANQPAHNICSDSRAIRIPMEKDEPHSLETPCRAILVRGGCTLFSLGVIPLTPVVRFSFGPEEASHNPRTTRESRSPSHDHTSSGCYSTKANWLAH
jgi:hypothetical protein